MALIFSFIKQIIISIRNIIIACIPSFIMKHPIMRKFIGFSFVGVIVTFIGLAQLYVLFKIIPNTYVAYIISYIISIFQSYWLNSHFVFKSEKTHKNLIVFYVVYGISMLIGVGTLAVYKYFLPECDDFVLSCLVIPVTMIWNFAVSSRYLKPVKNDLIEEDDIIE